MPTTPPTPSWSFPTWTITINTEFLFTGLLFIGFCIAVFGLHNFLTHLAIIVEYIGAVLRYTAKSVDRMQSTGFKNLNRVRVRVSDPVKPKSKPVPTPATTTTIPPITVLMRRTPIHLGPAEWVAKRLRTKG